MKDITIPEGFNAEIKGDKIVFVPKESEDEKIRKAIFKALSKKNMRNVILTENIKVSDALDWLERQKYKEKYDRLAPIYANQESFESALDKAWKFYNDSGSSTVDGCEDNAFELAFAKGFREGFLCKESQKEQKVDIDKLRKDIYQGGYDDGYQHGKEDAQKEQKSAEVIDSATFKNLAKILFLLKTQVFPSSEEVKEYIHTIEVVLGFGTEKPHWDELFEKRVDNCDSKVMKEVSDDEIDEMLKKAQESVEQSKDERINRAIFKALSKKEARDVLRNEHIQVSDALAYLEKQKKQKFDDVKREWWNKGYLEGRKNAHIPARELGLPSSCDFQKEQESALSKSEIDFADAYSKGVWGKLMSKFKNTKGYRIGCNDVSDIVLNAILDAFKWAKSRRTAAEWGEMDSLYRDNLIAYLNLRKDKNLPEDTKYPVLDAWIDWLKSLRPQPKQEWSDEDEQMLIRLCRIIHGCTLHRDQTFAEESEIGKWVDKWINHNPQPRWKPSEEQMDALETAVSSLQSTALEALYHKLEKL